MNEILLASASEAEIEICKSGTHYARHGGVFEATAEVQVGLVETFDPNESHELKLGHEPATTADPDLGKVLALRYDAAKDRLLAKIAPTVALVNRNREGYRNVSMELAPRRGRLVFKHLAFLGKHPPAIKGLAPVMLASTAGALHEIHLSGLSDNLSPSIQFAESESHVRNLVKLAEMRESDPSATYTLAVELLEFEANWNAKSWAKSDRYPKVTALLAEMRKADPKATFTQASEALVETAAR